MNKKKHFRIKVSDNAQLVKDVQIELEKNGGFCPKAGIKSRDTKCMCSDFRESREPGPCKCGLFVKEEVED